MTHGSIVPQVAAMAVVLAVAGAPEMAQAQETAIHTETRVQPFKPSRSGTGALTCRWNSSGDKAATALPAVFAGIVIDWLFTQGADYFGRRLDEKVRKYTIGYSTRPRYIDAFNAEYWSGDQSCVEMQRVHCTVARSEIEKGTAACTDGAFVDLSIVIKLKREKDNRILRVLPHTVQLWRLGEDGPQHDGGVVTVTARFHVESVGWTADAAGRPWASPDVPVAALECRIAKDRRDAEPSEDSCRREYFTAEEEADPDLWKRAHVLPLPPLNEQALMFSVAEVGEPKRGLKQFQKFFNAKGGDMSQALSDAFKKKLGIGQ